GGENTHVNIVGEGGEGGRVPPRRRRARGAAAGGCPAAARRCGDGGNGLRGSQGRRSADGPADGRRGEPPVGAFSADRQRGARRSRPRGRRQRRRARGTSQAGVSRGGAGAAVGGCGAPVSDFGRVGEVVLGPLVGRPEADWHQTPPGKWSPAQIVHHLAISLELSG